jgi:hypothetical protein
MLPFDEIPQDRKTLLDYSGRIGERNTSLAHCLAQWAGRDDSRPEPETRRAARTAMADIDAIVAECQSLRTRLTAETRQSDDAAAARVDALLRERPG